MFNFHIDNNCFASGLKEADRLLLKVFEPCLYYQIYGYIDAILSKDQVSASRIHYNN